MNKGGDFITPEQAKIVEDNHNLIYTFLHKYHLDIDEFYDLAAIGLCKASLTYSDEKYNFSTYAYRCMYSEIMMELRKNKYQKTIPNGKIAYYNAEMNNDDGDTIEYLNYIPSSENIEADIIGKAIYDIVKNKLKNKDKIVFDMLVDGYSVTEIAKRLKVSKQSISKRRKSIKEILMECDKIND